MLIKGKKITVTGGAGFIGSHLVDELVRNGATVVVLDNFATGKRENIAAHVRTGHVRIIEGDVRNRMDVDAALAGCDVVFHLATHCIRLSLSKPEENHSVNTTGTLIMLESARSAGVSRFIYCSSSEVFGNSGNTPLHEDSPKEPTTIYGASKLAGENYTLAYARSYGLKAIIARPFNTYGPRSHFAGPYGEVIPRFVIRIKAGKEPLIFGDGKQTRDFTFVTDTAAALIAAAQCDALLGSSINLARGQAVSILDIAKMLSKLGNSEKKPIHIESRPGDIHWLAANTTKAHKLLGDFAPTSIEEGLSKYWEWVGGIGMDFMAASRALAERNW